MKKGIIKLNKYKEMQRNIRKSFNQEEEKGWLTDKCKAKEDMHTQI